MTGAEPLNLAVVVFVSDPWEFGTECGTGPFQGIVADVTDENVLIRLGRPINYQGHEFRTVVAWPRHAGDSPRVIVARLMPANLVLLTQEISVAPRMVEHLPADGVAVVGSVERSS